MARRNGGELSVPTQGRTYLRNGGARDGFFVDVVEDGGQRLTQLGLHQGLDVIELACRKRILALAEHVEVLLRHDVSPRRQVLPKLHPESLQTQERGQQEACVAFVRGGPNGIDAFFVVDRQLVASPLTQLVIREQDGRRVEDL